MCYGGPFIIAFAYVFTNTQAKGPIYGPATLWCWIDINWVALRIATCYAPAWCCILLSSCIYALSGRKIFIKRQQLRAFNYAPTKNAPVENPFTGFKTTEIHITSELARMQSPDLAKVFLSPRDQIRRQDASPSPFSKHYDSYSVTIGSIPMGPKRVPMSPKNPREKVINPPMVPNLDLTPSTKPLLQQRKNRAALEANAAAWGYTKVAMLFFVSLLITWVSGLLPSVLLDDGQSAAVDTKSAGPLLRQPSLFSNSPGTRFFAFHIRLRCRPSPHGLLELRYLCRHIVAGSEAALHKTTT